MAEISPKVRPWFDTMSKALQEEIQSRDVKINSLADLTKCLEQVVEDGEPQGGEQ